MHLTHRDPSGSNMRYHTTQDQRPRKSWVAISYDESSGEVSEDSSPNMMPYKAEILLEAKAKFEERLKNDVLQEMPAAHDPASYPQPRSSRRGGKGGAPVDLKDAVKRSRSATIPLEAAREQAPRPRKVGKIVATTSLHSKELVSLNTSFSSHIEQDEIPGEKMIQFQASAQEKWVAWMSTSLCALSQVGCRTMAKEWIKAIHPKKQSTNPYNGRNPKTGNIGDPNDIKPVYWPGDVRHREPDHIKKEERMKLLVHLLMNTPHEVLSPENEAETGKQIWAQDFMIALRGKFDNEKYGLKGKKSIVQKIIEIRTSLEHYEEGGLPATAEIGAPDYTGHRRSDKDDDDDDITLDVIPDYEEYDGGDVNAPPPAQLSIEAPPRGTEVTVLPQPPLDTRPEPRSRNKTKKKSKRGTARSNTDPMPGRTYSSWDPSRLPPDYGMQAAQMPGYDGMTHHSVDNNGIPIAQQMHHSMTWDPMNGAVVPFQPQFHDPNLAEHRLDTNGNVDPNQFMGREYAMVPHQQQFCGGPHPHPHPYFQHSPSGNMPFPYDPSSMQGFDQGAYFPPPTSRPPM